MPRRVAFEVLLKIDREQAYSHIALSNALSRARLEARDRALATELVYGTLTWRRRIDGVLSQFVRRGLESLDLEVLTALRLGVYQLMWLDRIPEHAAVDQSVRLAKKTKGRGAGGFVNGVLRNVVRKSETIATDDPSWSLGMRTSMPDELAGELTARFGLSLGAEVAESFTTRAPLYVRTDAPWEALTPVEGVPGAFRAPGWSEELEGAL